MKWKQIALPALTTNLSTAQAQPLAREGWPIWAQSKADLSAAWLYPAGGSLAASTAALSTGHVQAYVDIERKATQGPLLRYYRYLYARTVDDRVFQTGPIKDIEYGHYRDQRPSWLAPHLAALST